jgi:hypothetical protein
MNQNRQPIDTATGARKSWRIPNTSPTFQPTFAETYNERLNRCDTTGTPHCELWDASEPFMLRFAPGELGTNLSSCAAVQTGAGNLADTGSDATTLVRDSGSWNINDVSRLVHNVTTGTTSVITAISGANATVVGGGFAAGDEFYVYNFRIPFNSTPAAAANTSVRFQNGRDKDSPVLCFDAFTGIIDYGFISLGANPSPVRATFFVTDYQSGRMNFGGGSIPSPDPNYPIAAAGNYDFVYNGAGFTIPAFYGDATAPFTGCLSMCMEFFRVRTNFWYQINGATPVPFSVTVDGLQYAEHGLDVSDLDCNATICVIDDLGELSECDSFQDVIGFSETPPDGNPYRSVPPCFPTEISDIFALYAYSPCELLPGQSYEFEIDTTGISGNSRVRFQDSSGVGFFDQNPITPGVHQFTVNIPAGTSTPIRWLINSLASAEGCFELRIRTLNAAPEPPPFMCSELYCIRELDNCDMILQWSNNTPAFGIAYPSATAQKAYPPARLINQRVEAFDYESGKGVDSFYRNHYSNAVQTAELSLSQVPPFVHNYLAVAFMHRTFSVNGLQMVAMEQYEPNYNDDTETANSRTRLAQFDSGKLVNPL